MFNGQDSDIAGTHALFVLTWRGIFWLSVTLRVSLYIVTLEYERGWVVAIPKHPGGMLLDRVLRFAPLVG